MLTNRRTKRLIAPGKRDFVAAVATAAHFILVADGEIKGNTFQAEIKYNPSLAPEMRSPARTTRSTTLMFCPCRYFAILIPVMIGGIVTRRVDGASFVDTDDTNSMGARHRDDTEGV
jgi:hypothetical protein